MKTKIFSLVTFLILFNSIFAQPDTLWTSVIGNYFTDVANYVMPTNDNGFIVVGNTINAGTYDFDIMLVKTDSNGDTMWTRQFGDSDNELGNCVDTTSDGGYIITGSKPFQNYNDIWLIKTDSNGDTLWTNNIGRYNHDVGYSVKQTSDGGYIITGVTYWSYDDLWLIKTDGNGDTLWTKTYGLYGNDKGYSLQQTSDDGYIVTGYTSSYGSGYEDIWLLKTDASGDTLWTKTFGGYNREGGKSVRETLDGGYIIVGYANSFGAGHYDVWLIKTDSNGDSLWSKLYGGINSDEGYSVCQTSDSGYILTGYTTSFGTGVPNIWIIKTDSIGDTLWTKIYGGTIGEYANCIKQIDSSEYIIAGYTHSFASTVYEDMWLIRLGYENPGGLYLNKNIVPIRYKLYQNYPNPFNPITTITFEMKTTSEVQLEIYNSLGQKVDSIFDNKLSAGLHKFSWNANDHPSGIYFYRLKVNGIINYKKCILMK